MKGEGRERARKNDVMMRKRERKVRKSCRKEKREENEKKRGEKRKELSMTLIFFSSSFF